MGMMMMIKISINGDSSLLPWPKLQVIEFIGLVGYLQVIVIER